VRPEPDDPWADPLGDPVAPVVAPVRVDDDGWPSFDEDALPEEEVAPDAEPPTEEVPVLRPADVGASEADTGDATDEDEFAERQSRRGRRGRRGGRGRGVEPRERAAPREDDAPPPSERGGTREPSRDGVLHFFRPERLDACQRAIGYHFRDLSLLENALTHSSIKGDGRPSYERLEFLGDSVVGLVISHYLYDLLPQCDEGELTRIKSMVVSTDGLADAARTCGLDRFLAVGRGLLMKEAVPKSLIADVFEGVAGAVYLDRGWESARLYVLDHLTPFVNRALNPESSQQNYKSVLQKVAQRDLGETPHYQLLGQSGAEHSRRFKVAAVLGSRRFPAAEAPTKREAEQAAAKIAIQMILLERGADDVSPRRREKHRHSGRQGPRRGRGGSSQGGRSR